MFGTAQQGISRLVLRVEGKGLLENLSGRVVVGGINRKGRERAAVKFHFCSVRERLVDVLVLARERCWIDNGKVNLGAKQVVEVEGREGIVSRQKALF